MPDLTPTTLRATVRSVVRKADARGDIDAGLFTLKTAKQQIGASLRLLRGGTQGGANEGSAKALGVEIEVLNAKEWKQTVKDLVFDAIVRSPPPQPSPFAINLTRFARPRKPSRRSNPVPRSAHRPSRPRWRC